MKNSRKRLSKAAKQVAIAVNTLRLLDVLSGKRQRRGY